MSHFPKLQKKLSRLSPVVLRVGIGIVFVYFGYFSLTSPSDWAFLVPEWVGGILPIKSLVQFHGLLELVLGFLLIVGAFVRAVSGLLFLSLLITVVLLFPSNFLSDPRSILDAPDYTFIRDVGLLFATLSIFLGSLRKRG